MQVLTSRSSGYGFGSLAELQESWVLWHGCTECTGVPGRYGNAGPVPRVFVALVYRTCRSSGYGREYPTDLTKNPSTGKSQVNTHDLGCAQVNTHGSGVELYL